MNDAIRAYNNQYPNIGKNVYIDPKATVIGAVKLDDDVVRGDVNSIEIGKMSNIQDGAVLHVTHDGPYTPGGFKLQIGIGVTVGHRAVLHGCQIGDYCLIGINAVVLDGAVLEDELIIGAGSLVPPGKHLKSGYLYLGNPIKPVRPLSQDEKDSLKYSAEHYSRLKNQYI